MITKKWQRKIGRTLLYSALLPITSSAFAEWGSVSGWVNAQTRFYPDTSENVEEQTYPAAAFELTYSQDLGDSDQFIATLFARGDSVDDERNYLDAREFLWLHHGENFQTRVGVGQVSWGVNEIFKITDLINQKDRAELPFQKKLGQPMASLSFYWGEQLIELYAMYDVRPAWYPGEDGRLRYPLLIDADNQKYDRGKTGKTDFAAKWKTRWGDMDISLSHFYGVTRDPYFIFNYDFADPLLIPVYEKVNQTSIDLVYPWGDVLLKAEATYQTGSIEQFESVVGGFEYTQGGLFDSNLDLTWYVEAIWDSRDQIDGTLFDHDIGIAGRLALNDARDSNLVLGVVADYEYDEAFGYFFWTNTFGSSWTLNITGQYFLANEPRLDPAEYASEIQAFTDEIEAGTTPIPQQVIDDMLALYEGTTIGKKQFDRVVEEFDRIQIDPTGYSEDVDFDNVPQTLFDLIRISDNSQKMNLIERDAYIQVDVFYHF